MFSNSLNDVTSFDLMSGTKQKEMRHGFFGLAVWPNTSLMYLRHTQLFSGKIEEISGTTLKERSGSSC